MISALLSTLVLLAPPGGAPAERPLPIARGGGTIAATITVPARPGPHPLAVLVGGFGPTDRDGAFGGAGRGVYAEIARGLARRGVAVLRYDKRGIRDSDGDALSWLDARVLARDAVTVARAALALPGVDGTRTALIGHSQGGDLALQASRSLTTTRVVTLAAPGRPLGLLPRAAGRLRAFLGDLTGPAAARATLGRDPRGDARAARQPALLVHGTRDGTVPASDMALLARARGDLPTRTLTVPGAGHFLQVDGRVPEGVLDEVAAFVGR